MSVNTINQIAGQQPVVNPNNANDVEKNAKSAFENAVETFKTNTAKSMSSIKETHYRAISEKTKELSAGKAIWQRIKNIAHNIKAFMSSPMLSATEIGKEAQNLVNTLNTEAFRKDLIEVFKNDLNEAEKMLRELTKQFNGIEKLKSEGNHNGNCGRALDCAKNFLELASKVVAECHKEAKNEKTLERENETAQKQYNDFQFKNTVSAYKTALNDAKSKLEEILKHDANLTFRKKIDNTMNTISETISITESGYELAKDSLVQLSETNPYAKKELQEINNLSKTVDELRDRINH